MTMTAEQTAIIDAKLGGPIGATGAIAALPWAQIIAIIMSLLQIIPSICPTPAPVPPKNNFWSRFVVRRHLRKVVGLDETAMADFGNQLAADLVTAASTCTPAEWATLLA
jgi:hypothetical protein